MIRTAIICIFAIVLLGAVEKGTEPRRWELSFDYTAPELTNVSGFVVERLDEVGGEWVEVVRCHVVFSDTNKQGFYRVGAEPKQ